MFGGLGKAGWATILVTGGLMLGTSMSAQAADLGGDCCTDLEERIAELEATTARKGNRKVSLAISGWVNEAVFFWDDGTEQNVYVGTNALEQSRFKFAGKAKIDKDWSAGYTIEIGILGANSNSFSQTSTGSSNTLSVRKSYWYLKSKTYGTLSVGQNGTATYHLLDDADATNTRNYSDAEAAAAAMGAFQALSNGTATGLAWSDILRGFNNRTPGQSGRRNVVRYDSPEFAGFVVTAAWGEDDMWDAALVYKGEIGDFKVRAQVGYGESTDPGATGGVVGTSVGGCAAQSGGYECQWAGAAGTIMHKPTGLYVFGGYGMQTAEPLANPAWEDESTVWIVQPGIEKKWHPIGKTTIFAEYRHDEPGSNNNKDVLGADIDFYAAGVVQNVEAAAMDLYAIYRHAEGDYTTKAGANVGLDDFDMLITGARIQF